MKTNKNEKLIAIELALGEVLNVEKMNTWISVKDRSISSVIKEAGVHKNYAPIIMDELQKLGLVEKEGERSAMRYKISSNVIPDISHLASKIYKRFSDKAKFGNSLRNEGYPESDKRDLKPFFPKTVKEDITPYSSKPKVLKGSRAVKLPNLGDMRFIIDNNKIVEGRIISLHYGDDGKRFLYNLEIINEKWVEEVYETEQPDFVNKTEYEEYHNNLPKQYLVRQDISVKDLFETPSAAADFMVRHLLKYMKR